ncbi:MAG: aspartate 1-decarboxylase [Firmicutes bacterium]|nr:aspartate 1-decarboxylase [Bacillota bacterium]
MIRQMMHAKLHRGRVTDARLDYVGSITIDEALLERAGILENERVQVLNITTGARIETYAIKGARNSGTLCLNGAAARLFQPGDEIIVIAYGLFSPEELRSFQPTVLLLDAENHIVATLSGEQAGPYLGAN